MLLTKLAAEPVFPPSESPIGAPDRLQFMGELALPLDAARLVAAAPRLRKGPRLEGAQVMDIPGWRSPEHALGPIRQYLRYLGADAQSWGLGTNDGRPQEKADALAPKVEAMATRAKVHLVGWSLGGVVAREIGRLVPQAVASITTFGSPIIGGPLYTVASRSFGIDESQRIAEEADRAERTPLKVPVTVIYSKRDGIVDWRACLDHRTPHAQHHEVSATHFGLGLHPTVWWLAADTIARHQP